MELQFEKVGNRWIAEVEVTGNYNLNIKRVKPGSIKVFQKGSADGDYSSIASWEINYAPSVVDNDFSALFYPKYIKVVSESEPIQGIVTMDGEGGSSGSGGGLRPITADDVTIYYGSMYGEAMPTTPIEWADILDLPGQQKYWFVLNNQNAVTYIPMNKEYADTNIVDCGMLQTEDGRKYISFTSEWAGTAHIYPSKIYIKD